MPAELVGERLRLGREALGAPGELRRPHDRREQRGGGQIGDRERVADEVAARTDLLLDAIERALERLPRLGHAIRADAVVVRDERPCEPERRAEEPRARLVVRAREDRAGERRVAEDQLEDQAPDLRAELLVELVLERERAGALRGVRRVERRLRPAPLDLGDDPRRVRVRLTVDRRGSAASARR